MGSTQSIFYPDNEKRLKRAQQLADDCQYAKQQYDASKARLEKALGPYKEKLDKLLQAFDCRNIGDLDQLILKSATGEALQHWQRVRKNYDQSLIVDQVIMGAEAIVTIGGIAISAIGALAGGFGFFAGLGVTADILLVLGAIGALYDIINGAIQRSKLRDAINEFIPTRLKAKFAQEQMEHLEKTLPTIQTIYQTYEDLGYNKEKILQKFKDHNWLKNLKSGAADITYMKVGQELLEMDSRRDSWTNEDLEWRPVAEILDRTMLPTIGGARMMFAKADFPSAFVHEIKTDPAHDGEVSIKLLGDDINAALFSKPLHVKLNEFESNDAAKVRVSSQDDKQILVHDLTKHTVHWASSEHGLKEALDVTLRQSCRCFRFCDHWPKRT
ncbi:hypothetical protein C8Q75DRAFT_40757 [Abortiporus biennis]|nr:hypothetical protein C8Q75DRAFT_40757 [Abortiporus biennis]